MLNIGSLEIWFEPEHGSAARIDSFQVIHLLPLTGADAVAEVLARPDDHRTVNRQRRNIGSAVVGLLPGMASIFHRSMACCLR